MIVISEGIEPMELTLLARRYGLGDWLFPEADLAGFTARCYGLVVAIGGVALHPDGRVWAGLVGPCRPVYHRAALRLFEALGAAGVREVWADTLPEGAVQNEKWLRRLGFEPQPGGDWRKCLQQH